MTGPTGHHAPNYTPASRDAGTHAAGESRESYGWDRAPIRFPDRSIMKHARGAPWVGLFTSGAARTTSAPLETPPESPLASLRRPLARAGDRASPSQQVAQLGFFRCRRGSDVLVECPGFDLWQMTVRQSLD